MKESTKKILMWTVAIVIVIAIIYLLRKKSGKTDDSGPKLLQYTYGMETDEAIPLKEKFRYEEIIKQVESFRYQNFKDFSDFRSQFKNAILIAVKGKTIAEKKELMKNVKKIFDLYLEDNSKLKYVYTFVMNLIVDQLIPLVQRELNKVLINEDGTLKSYAATMCRLGKEGPQLFSEMYNKYVAGPLGNAIDQIFAQDGIKLAVAAVKLLGINLKSLIISAVQSLAQDKLGNVIEQARNYMENVLSTVLKRKVECRPPPTSAAAFVVPSDIVMSETDAADFADL